MGGAPARPDWVPSSAVYWRGHWFDVQTRDMLQELAATSGAIYVDPIQGCWSRVVVNSAETHARACVVDLNAEHLDDDEAQQLVTLWRSMGGFGWFRPRTSPSGYVYGWQRHAHLGHPDGDMAEQLRDQWDDYLADRNGLANNGPDTGTRAYVGMTWARYRKEHDTMTPEQLAQVLAAIGAVPGKVWAQELTGHDEDGKGPAPAPKAPALSWLVMARRDAGRAYWNTDSLEATQANLAAQLRAVDAKASSLAAKLDTAVAQGDLAPELVDELRQALSSFRLELVPITVEGTPA
jgi:hypothetical protein